MPAVFTPSYLEALAAQVPDDPPPARPQARPSLKAPMATAIAGQAADAASTLYNFSRGFGESNGVYGGGQPTGRVLATKAAIGLGIPLLMRELAREGHPTVAKWLGYGTGVAGAVPAAINLGARR